jgi:hypothetical protein
LRCQPRRPFLSRRALFRPPSRLRVAQLPAYPSWTGQEHGKRESGWRQRYFAHQVTPRNSGSSWRTTGLR